MPSLCLSRQLTDLYQQACHTQQRRLLVLAGAPDWARSVLQLLPEPLVMAPGLWVSNGSDLPAGWSTERSRLIKPSRCHQILGQEFSRVVLDCYQGVDADALGACSGTLRGGGLLVLLLPSFDQPADSPFQDWLRSRLTPRDGVLVVRQDQVLADPRLAQAQQQAQTVACSSLPAGLAPLQCPPSTLDPDCLTDDQAKAVQQIMRVAQGHRRRPLVVSADRGRGKSAALGIAAARLMLQRPRIIRVTAPSVAAVEPMFERLQALLPESRRQGSQIGCGDSLLQFVALDLLLAQTASGQQGGGTCDLLLVDEAAAIPAPLLERLLRHHHRVVFATTTHGYEGTGRGFQLRFRKTLDQYTPSWRQLELQTPIRWRAGDPLERWVFETLLLDAEPDAVAHDDLAGLDLSALSFRRWSPQQLLADPHQLRQLFALLVQAHYRTKPGDLRDLLDDPAMQIWLLHRGQQLVGVLWLAEEGGFESPLADAIWLGQRRPRGHLLPQVLAAQAGWRQAPTRVYWRIVRIAVPDPLRRRGLGGELVQRLLAVARQSGRIDLVGTSFGATADLLPFWFNQQMQPLRLGLKRDASSGCVSLIYGCACSPAGRSLLEQVADRFVEDLPRQLQGANADLEPDLVRLLLPQIASTPDSKTECSKAKSYKRKYAVPGKQDLSDLYTFAFGQRQLEQVEPALYRWAMWLLSGSDPVLEQGIDPLLEQFLIQRLIQRRSWPELLVVLKLSGPRQVEQWLRQALRPLLADLAGLPGPVVGS